MREIHRYLGLELSGAKNHKTALAALEFYPKEKKIFLLEIYDRISTGKKSADESLIDLLQELSSDCRPNVVKLGVNVALELPPCITCTRKLCPLPSKCTVPAVKWMRETTRKAMKSPELAERVRDFTPFTQRPMELYLRYQALPRLPESHRFEIDETLGGNRAPLTARMHFLRRHLPKIDVHEALPKLTVAVLGLELELNKRVIASYRHLEQGIHAREIILDALSEQRGIFIYERDRKKLTHNLATFDSFICAYTVLLADNHACEKPPAGFPVSSGWIDHPAISSPSR